MGFHTQRDEEAAGAELLREDVLPNEGCFPDHQESAGLRDWLGSSLLNNPGQPQPDACAEVPPHSIAPTNNQLQV